MVNMWLQNLILLSLFQHPGIFHVWKCLFKLAQLKKKISSSWWWKILYKVLFQNRRILFLLSFELKKLEDSTMFILCLIDLQTGSVSKSAWQLWGEISVQVWLVGVGGDYLLVEWPANVVKNFHFISEFSCKWILVICYSNSLE